MLSLQTNRVAVIPMFDPDKYGSIWVPEQAKERVDQGIVKYIGPKVELVKVGDHVIFSGYTGTLFELPDEGSLLIILPEDFITARFDDHSPFDVGGLYFKDTEGNYFTATYEQAMVLIAKSMNEQFNDRVKFNINAGLESRPKLKEYEDLH